MAAIEKQEFLLGRAVLEKIDKPLQLRAVDLRLIGTEILGAEEDLSAGTRVGMAEIIDDQPAVRGDPFEEIRDLPLEGDRARVAEEPHLVGGNPVPLGQGVGHQGGVVQGMAQRAERLVVVVLHRRNQGPACGVNGAFRGDRRGGNGRVALGIDRAVLDSHPVSAAERVQRDCLVAQRDFAIRPDEVRQLLPVVLGHAERLRHLVTDLLHDPAASQRPLGDDLDDGIVVLELDAVAALQARRFRRRMAVDRDHVLRGEGQLDHAVAGDHAQPAAVEILGQDALELDHPLRFQAAGNVVGARLAIVPGLQAIAGPQGGQRDGFFLLAIDEDLVPVQSHGNIDFQLARLARLHHDAPRPVVADECSAGGLSRASGVDVLELLLRRRIDGGGDFHDVAALQPFEQVLFAVDGDAVLALDRDALDRASVRRRYADFPRRREDVRK